MKQPQWFTLKQIAAAYGRPISTTHAHIEKLTKRRDFTKLSLGRFYDEEEALKLAELLKIPVEKLKLKPNGSK